MSKKTRRAICLVVYDYFQEDLFLKSETETRTIEDLINDLEASLAQES